MKKLQALKKYHQTKKKNEAADDFNVLIFTVKPSRTKLYTSAVKVFNTVSNSIDTLKYWLGSILSIPPPPKAGHTLIISHFSTCSCTISWDCEPITIHFSQYHRFRSSLMFCENSDHLARWEKWLARRFTKCHLYTSRFSCFANIFSRSRQFDDKCIAGSSRVQIEYEYRLFPPYFLLFEEVLIWVK